MLKAIVFDVDGVLIDSNKVIIKAYKITAKKLGLRIPSTKEIIDLLGEPLEDITSIPHIEVKPVKGFKMDPLGVFRIWVDLIEKEILVVHYSAEGEKTKAFIGDSSPNLYCEILNEGLVSEMSHAAYLGSELSKAEACLKLGKTYMQDEPF